VLSCLENQAFSSLEVNFHKRVTKSLSSRVTEFIIGMIFRESHFLIVENRHDELIVVVTTYLEKQLYQKKKKKIYIYIYIYFF